MTTIVTDLGNTRESARRIRFEPNDGLTETNVQKAIEEAYTAAIAPPSIAMTAVTFAMSPYTVLTTDTFLAVDTSGGAVTINLGAAAARGGIPLTVKDVTGNASTNNITVAPNGAETIDGLASVAINIDFGGYEFVPQTGGYTLAP